MYCEKCGKKLEENVKFCDGCGAEIKDSTSSKNKISKDEIITKLKDNKNICIGACALLVIIILFVAFSGDKKLTCTTTSNGQKMKVVIYFNKDDYAKRVVATTTYKNKTKEEINYFQKNLSSQTAYYKRKGIDVKTKVSGKTIKITLDGAPKYFGYYDESYDEIKAEARKSKSTSCR